ncbi:MAG: fibronectin type III domain-containing protein [Bacteroidales bacterium]|nr:fibronectin type III domain-containing protein [Bacteroidales bacterium]
MRAIHTIMRTLALAAVLLPLASCVQKEVQLPALSQPGNISYDADFGSLSLTWAPVDNAAQYYYKLENALGYTVAKGTTRNTYVTVGSLQPATTYTVRIKAIPAGVDAKTYAASDFYVTEATTAAPKSYDFEWSYPATIWWYYDTDVYHETKGKTTFGYDKTLQAYVIQAWGGVMGMDIVFTLSDSGEWLINYAESTAYTGGPDGNMAVGLAHGIGGTAATTCWFYTNNTGSSLELSSTGGRGYAWMYNPDGNWSGYCVEFGEYTPDPPAPFVPTADATESWAKDGTAYFEGEELGPVSIAFDVATGQYTIESWYGVEGHGIAFTRNAETGLWQMNTEASTAYIDGPYEGTGLYELSHGKYGKGLASTLLLDPSDSGYDGDGENGNVWARVTDPSGKTGTYEVRWVTDLSPFKWACDIYVNGTKLDGTGVISYDGQGTYTLQSWYGVPGYDLVFTLDGG